MTWMCITRLDRGDSIEGQALALGSRTECDELADALPAIAIGGDRPVVDARIIVADVPDGAAIRVGDVYRVRKEREKRLAEKSIWATGLMRISMAMPCGSRPRTASRRRIRSVWSHPF